MNWNITDLPIAQEWARALCLTLVHSLWQGLLAAIVTGGILLCTRTSKPEFRYNLLASVLMLFVIGAGLTFSLMLRDVSQGSGGALSGEWMISAAFQDAGNAAIVATENGWVMQAMAFFNRNAQVIVTVWFLIFTLKSLMAASGLLYLRKVAAQVSAPDMKWIIRFYELADRMRVNQEVELRESVQVAVPIVIGFIKPIVLVPLGMLANLPAAQVEAILLHELAHIRRRDYLVNLLQVFCENIFFFNPAVWWMSKLIREEREHCCDDLAISVIHNKTSFIQALVSFQEYNQSRPVFEMAFSKKRNHLLERIKRIINNNNKPLNAMEKLFVTFSLAAAIVLSAATTPQNAAKGQRETLRTATQPQTGIPAPVKPEVKRLPDADKRSVSKPDTLPGKKLRSAETEIHAANIYTPREGISTYNVTRNNKQYEIVQRNGKIISLFVDDQEIAAGDYVKYQPEIDKIMEDVKAQHEIAEKQREEAQQMRKIAEEQRRLAEKQREQAHEMRLEAEKQREHASQMRIQADQMRREAEKQRELAAEQRVQAEGQRKQAEEMRKQAEKQREVYLKRQEAVIEDLADAGLVKDKSDLSFKLSDDELIVNGAKQSAELHRKLKAKYLDSEEGVKSEMYYNYNGRSGYSTRAR